MRVASLGSGSSGNALVVQSGSTALLLDCGFTMKETVARMAELGMSPADLDGILVSHEHGDHVRGLGPLSRKFAIDVWLTHGTYHALRDQRFSGINLINAHHAFRIGDIDIDPFPTPHDARESCQYIFSASDTRFACVTDLGTCTPHVQEKLAGISGLLVECNYDEDMLRNGPYPAILQARIRSDFGHLGNVQAGELVQQIDHAGMQRILLGHLSEQNNNDDIALATMCEYLPGNDSRVTVLQQHACSGWIDVQPDATAATAAESKAPEYDAALA